MPRKKGSGGWTPTQRRKFNQRIAERKQRRAQPVVVLDSDEANAVVQERLSTNSAIGDARDAAVKLLEALGDLGIGNMDQMQLELTIYRMIVSTQL